MAVSYLSKTFSSSPYVLPIDLGLFANVLSIKQKKFDDNAQRVQSQIDQMGLLDVIKPEDQQYLNSKINNIVNTVNNLGGVDFSDPNTALQIEALGSDVYGDKSIINAVASTKRIRGLQNSYEKFKTDPKLAKFYSEANEGYDMRRVSEYMSDGQVGSVYSGPRSATPYTPYRDNHIKAFERVKADMQTTLTDNGLYYSKVTGEYIHPERIMSMAADLLSPQEKSQMQRDGWYMYNRAAPADLVIKAKQQFSAKKQDAEVLLDRYKSMAAAAVSDPIARDNYTTLAEQQQKVVESLNTLEAQIEESTIKRLEENPEGVYFELYSNDYFRGLGNRFSVNRTDRSIIPNTAKMFELKMTQADQQFRDRMLLEERKVDMQLSQNQESNAIELLKIGKYRHVDPFTGQISYLDLPGYKNGHLITQTPNIEDVDDLKTNQTSLENVNNDLKVENDKLAQQFLSNLIGLRPELGEEIPSLIGSGTTRKFKDQSVLEGFNTAPGFQLDDLSLFETTTDKEGFPVFKNQKQVSEFALRNKLNTEQLTFLANQYKNFESLALGKGAVTPDLIDGFPQLVEKHLLNNERIKANNKKIADAYAEVFEEYKNQGTDIEGLKKFIRPSGEEVSTDIMIEGFRKSQGPPGTGPTGTFLDDLTAAWMRFGTTNPLAKKLRRDVEKRVNEKLSGIATRDVYGMRTLSEKEPLYSELPSLISQEIADDKAEPYRDFSEVEKEAIRTADKSIVPRMIGKTSDGTGRWMVISDVTVGTGEKQFTTKYRSYISDANASKFGLERDPYEAINYSVKVNGRTGDIPIYGSKDLSIFVNVTRYGTTDINDDSSIAQIKVYKLDNNGQKTGKYSTIEIPNTQGRTPSESYVLAKEAVQKAAALGLKHEDFINYIKNYKNR